MATHSSILAWKIPGTEEPSPWGRKELDTTEWLHFHFYFIYSSVDPLLTIFFGNHTFVFHVCEFNSML